MIATRLAGRLETRPQVVVGMRRARGIVETEPWLPAGPGKVGLSAGREGVLRGGYITVKWKVKRLGLFGFRNPVKGIGRVLGAGTTPSGQGFKGEAAQRYIRHQVT